MSKIPIHRPETVSKKLFTIRLDEDIIEAFKAEGAGYQTRINDALRKHLNEKD
jgi:uncharacterized protein (DUF4415 family)